MTVDAIVVNFNTRELLRASLASLYSSRHPVRRVFVVDNASVDGSAQMVTAEFPDVVLLEMPENLGFARANNAAFELCEADALLLLNSDAELSADALGELIDELSADDRVGVAGPVLVGDDGLVQYEGGRRDPSILGEFGNISHLNARLPHSVFGCYLMSDWDHRSTRDVEVLSGACMLVRASALGGRLFCEDFFMYGEDIELCQRLRAAGWRLRYVGAAKVAHRGGATSRRARTKMRIAGVVSMAQLLRRARGPLYVAGYAAIVPFAWPLGVIIRKVWPR
jgi:N-acetylglucosaminyl-diphospho-decaprenol L-rhamnosyltransferase